MEEISLHWKYEEEKIGIRYLVWSQLIRKFINTMKNHSLI